MRHVGWGLTRTALAAFTLLAATTSPWAAGKVECHAGGDYVVIARDRADSAGADFLVRKAAPGASPPCAYEPTAGDFVLADASKHYRFEDVRDDYLILTEPAGSSETVVVYDLPTRRKVLDLTAADLRIDDRGIYFWARVEEGTPQTCRTYAQLKSDGLQPVIETKARFIFAEAKMIEIKARRCVGAK